MMSMMLKGSNKLARIKQRCPIFQSLLNYNAIILSNNKIITEPSVLSVHEG
jgi:hypothetical protein